MAVLNPRPEMNPVERLNAELLAGRTATEVLEERCAALGLAAAPRVHAEVRRDRLVAGEAAARLRLEAGDAEELGYRRVYLMCGAHVLSEALNWYVASRLTPAMNEALETSDVPFGRVILPLAPSRRTISTRILWDGSGAAPSTVLRHRALVVDGQGRPLAEVIENYRAILVTGAAG
ncbi:hypothetical protein OK349_08620 [Sphingomonas sp. BT-65]|uniref:hypothetical protein n=1 Tax=Sphingomonas sp. BT-65 TaxID=2989821 RepID=UPI0022354D8F|nr:hypothetical protein [Sphingomonas sp. BT-65]MCW4461771.1 hypothetical protein [Sphingomonas sp. BT-65]